MHRFWLFLGLAGCGKDGETASDDAGDTDTDTDSDTDTDADTDTDSDTDTAVGPTDTAVPSEICDDDIDNDLDGNRDCQDTDCALFCDADQDGQFGEAMGGPDCNDSDPLIFDGAAEVCDSVDNDCDLLVDDADPNWDPATGVDQFADLDQDLFGGGREQACALLPGNVLTGGDCDDADAALSPGASEVCDHVDNNCDDLVDELDPSLDPALLVDAFADADRDGYGDAASPVQVCFVEGGDSLDASDCDDNDPAIGPPGDWLVDVDNDGYGDGVAIESGVCAPSDPDLVPEAAGVDCNPIDPSVHPGAAEVCNDGIDQDCNGLDDCHPAIEGVVALVDLQLAIEGIQPASNFGFDVALADVTGDGQIDVIGLSALTPVPNGGVGTVGVFPGPLGPTSLRETDATYTFTGVPLSLYMGLQAGTDFTGDGQPDLLVGDVTANNLDGAAHLLAGPIAGGGGTVPLSVASLQGPMLSGVGSAFGGPTDFDADGNPEAWIGALDLVGVLGFWYVAEGPFAGPVNLAGIDRVDGAIDQPVFAYGAPTDDFDADGLVEVALPSWQAYGTNGAVFVFGHRPIGVEGSGDADAEFSAVGAGDQAGAAACAPGDVNGDGYADLAVGAPLAGDGAVYVMSGPLTSGSLSGALLTITGLPGEGLGGRLGAAGDLDADGSFEVLAGEFGLAYNGLPLDSYLLDLGTTGSVLRDAVTDMTVPDPGSSQFGFRTAAGGDLDADGWADLLVGAPYANYSAGAIYGIFGSPL